MFRFTKTACKNTWDFLSPRRQAQDTKRVLSELKGLFKKPEPVKIEAEPVIKTEAETIQHHYEQANIKVEEAHRLEAMLPEAKTLYVVRKPERMGDRDFEFMDKKFREAEYWMLKQQDPTLTIYEESWADDPSTGRMRVLRRKVANNA